MLFDQIIKDVNGFFVSVWGSGWGHNFVRGNPAALKARIMKS
jgi:hypothetical protein